MGAHAQLPPSGAPSWAFCALWPTMNAKFPQEDSEDSLNGTGAHWGFVELFHNRPISLDSVADNGVRMTQEMLAGAALYVRTVDEDLRALGLDRSVLRVEQPIAIPSVHPLNWGTPDTWFGWNKLGVRLYDYKFGHKFVDSYENWQLVDYLQGIIDFLSTLPGGFDDTTTPFELVVIQPRNYDGAGPVRRWKGTCSDLRWMANRLREQAAKATAPNPTATTGDHCYECPGRHACPALQQQGYKAVTLSRASVPLELSDDAVGNELYLLRRAAVVLKERIGGLEQDVMARLMRGRVVPRSRIDEAVGRESWNKPAEEVAQLGQLMGIKLAETKVLTPKQAVEAGMPAVLVASMTVPGARSLRLVEDDGKKAAKAFGKK